MNLPYDYFSVLVMEEHLTINSTCRCRLPLLALASVHLSFRQIQKKQAQVLTLCLVV